MMFRYLIALFAVTLPVFSQAEKPDAGDEIRAVVVLSRHGVRAPLNSETRGEACLPAAVPRETHRANQSALRSGRGTRPSGPCQAGQRHLGRLGARLDCEGHDCDHSKKSLLSAPATVAATPGREMVTVDGPVAVGRFRRILSPSIHRRLSDGERRLGRLSRAELDRLMEMNTATTISYWSCAAQFF